MMSLRDVFPAVANEAISFNINWLAVQIASAEILCKILRKDKIAIMQNPYLA